MTFNTCCIGLLAGVLLAGCGSGASPEEAQTKDAALDSQPGSPTTADSGPSLGADSASGFDAATLVREDAATAPLDTSVGSTDTAREALVVDARVADLGVSTEGGTVKRDGADTSPPSFPCSDDSECCIKTDTCMNVATMYSTAPGASPAPEIPSSGTCTKCIPPIIQVRCVSHQCVGERLPTASAPMVSSHCGPLKLPDAGTSGTHLLPPLVPDASAPPPRSSWTCSGG